MALESPERAVLHHDLADHLGRTTADRLMAALPDVEYFDRRFDAIDERFKRVDEEFRLVHKEFELVHKELGHLNHQFGRVNEQFGHLNHQFGRVNEQFGYVNYQFEEVHKRLDRLDARFENVDEIIEGKVDVKLVARVRSTFFAILGLTAAYAAMLAAIVGMALAAAD